MYRMGLWNVAIGVAAVAGGLWLYSRYGPRRHRTAVALSAGTTLGHEVGALAGLAIGPVAVLPATVAGAVAGALIAREWMGKGEPKDPPRV